MKYTFLALLAPQPVHGYELKQSFEQLFGMMRSLNAGQIYTTLQRLQRDELVKSHAVAQADRPNKRVYEITDAGRAALREWIAQPTQTTRLKDDFFVKLSLATFADVGDPLTMITQQRFSCLQTLREMNQMAINSAEPQSPAQELSPLLIEGAILHLEADLKWLDMCEQHFVSRQS